MENTKCIAITLVLIGVFCGTFALAQTAAPKVDDFRAKAEKATHEALNQLIYSYKPTEDQKAKLKEILVVQYKDIMDYDKVRAPKIKALDDEIAAINTKIVELQKEVAVIEKRKTVYAKARAELLLDHKAEINNAITPEQRIARLSNYMRGNAVSGQYWAVLPKATQDSLKEKCDAAALELVAAGKGDDRNAVYTAHKKIRDDANKMLTPEIRQSGDTEYLLSHTIRKFASVKLTDAQKSKIRDMCDKEAKRKVEIYAQYEKIGKDLAALDKDRDAIRRTINGMTSSAHYYKIREDVVESVLTDEQLKQGGFRRKSATPGKKL